MLMCALHERLGAESPAQSLNQYLLRDIAELVKSRNSWREKGTRATVSEEGRRIAQHEDCSNFLITSEEPIEPGEISAWRITIESMDPKRGTMRYFGIHTGKSSVGNDHSRPLKGDFTIRVRRGQALGPTEEESTRKLGFEGKTGDVMTFILDRRKQPHTLRLFFNDMDCGIVFEGLPSTGPLFPCITQQHDTDVIIADFDIPIPNF